MEKEEFRKGAAGAIATARARLNSALTEQGNLTSPRASGCERAGRGNVFPDSLLAVQQRVRAAQEEIEHAESFARSREIAWSRISAAIDERRNLAETWDRVGLEEHGVLLDWWVLDVLIVVEPIPGMNRANKTKHAIVTLRSAPDAPQVLHPGWSR
jgi:hypothetical protein